MKSMTGFGAASLQDEMHSIEVNIKSVNGRYLDLRFHLPKEYIPLELTLKKILKKAFQRGTVDIFIGRAKATSGRKRPLQVKTAQGKEWLKAYSQLAKQLGLEEKPKLTALIQMGQLIVEDERDPLSRSEEKKVLELVSLAAAKCESEKSREGKALQKNLLSLLNKLQKVYQQMAELRKKANEELEKKFRQKLQQYSLDRQEWESRWTMELAILIDRSDIQEEMVRLKEHIKNFVLLAEGGEQSGKKMDFYCQELLRETNTIGSKSQVAKLTHLVVDAKSLIEQLREQVQNVE